MADALSLNRPNGTALLRELQRNPVPPGPLVRGPDEPRVLGLDNAEPPPPALENAGLAGAPVLDPPPAPMSPDEVLLLVMQAMALVSDGNAETMSLKVRMQGEIASAAIDDLLKAIEQMAKQIEEARRKAKEKDAISWVQAIGGAVLAITMVATAIGTGGLASPLLIAAAPAALAATAALVEKIDGPGGKFEGYMMGDIMSGATKISEEAGADPEATMGVVIGLAVALTVVQLAAGSYLKSGAAMAANADKLGKAADKAYTMASIAQGLTGGSTGVAEGTVSLELAEINKETAHARADSEEAQALVELFQGYAQRTLDMLQQIVQKDHDRTRNLSELFSSKADNLESIARNTGTPSA